jgi:hypothetical protein
MPGGAPRGRLLLDSGPGQRCMRLSLHVLVVVFCGLDWGTRRYSRGAFKLRPQFVEYVGMRPSNPPRNVASFKNAESVATAPQLRAVACDGALSASAARNRGARPAPPSCGSDR